MKKSKKILATLLASFLILGLFTVIGFAVQYDPDTDEPIINGGNGATLTLDVKYFTSDGTAIDDLGIVSPGDAIKARVYVGTDYYTHNSDLVLYYDDDFFSSNYTASTALTVNMQNITAKAKIYETDTAADGETAIYIIVESSSTSVYQYNINDWLFELDFTVAATASTTEDDGIGAVYAKSSDLRSETNDEGYINVPYADEGDDAYDTLDLYMTSAISAAFTNDELTVNNTVTFNPNHDDEAVITVSGRAGAAYTVPTVTRAGYTFQNWTTEATGVTLGTMPADTGVVYVANWGQNVDIHVDKANGEAVIDILDVEGGTPWLQTVAEPTRTGYRFAGWEGEGVVADANGINQLPANYPAATANNNEFTYVAQWDKYVTITFNDGENNIGNPYEGNPVNGIYGGAAWDTSVVPQYNVVNYKNDTVSKAGYMLLGWRVNGGSIIRTFPATYPEDDTVYTAVWRPMYVNVYYFVDSNAASAADVAATSDPDNNSLLVDSVQLTYDDTAYRTASFSGEDFTVIGWAQVEISGSTVTPTGTTVAPNSAMPWSIVSFKANGAPNNIYFVASSDNEEISFSNTHVATFDPQGGTWSDSTTASKSLSFAQGTAVTAPAFTLTKEGYEFAGWAPELGVMGSVDETYNAVWDEAGFTVTYVTDDAYDSTAEYDKYTVDYGSPIATELPEDPERDGYRFDGWVYYTDTAFTNEITDGNMPASDVYAKAQWTALNFTIDYDANGGTLDASTTDPETVVFGTLITEPTDPVWQGHTFTGWEYKNADTDEVVAVSYGTTTMPAFDLIATAQWDLDEYDLTYYLNGTAVDGYPIKVAYGNAIPQATAPQEEGYTFSGWCSDSACTTPFDFTQTMPAEDVEIYGTFIVNKHNVTWEYNDLPNDNALVTLTDNDVEFGTVLTTLAHAQSLATEGYDFVWKLNGAELTSAMTMPDEDITIVGTFTRHIHKVTFVKGNGVWSDAATGNKEFDIYYGAEVVEPAETISRQYYNFKGWVNESDSNKAPSDYALMPDTDLTFTAVWERVEVKLIPSGPSSTVMIERDGVVETYNTFNDGDPTPAGVTSITAPTVTRAEAANGFDSYYIYGLSEGISVEQFEATVAVQGDGVLSVTTITSGSVGTGSLVTVTDNVTNEVVEQFYVIIFGDVDGDAIARSADTGEVKDEIGDSFWSANGQAYKIKAADLDGSGFLTGTDVSRLKAAVRNTKEINQITGLAV
jgi:uncharacterized repeat protein (TIGR02543 family)